MATFVLPASGAVAASSAGAPTGGGDRAAGPLRSAAQHSSRAPAATCRPGTTFVRPSLHTYGVCHRSGRWTWQRVVVHYGDSLSSQATPYIRHYLALGGEYRVESRTLGGTAPCDWLRQARLDRDRYAPAAVVFQFSGNVLGGCMAAERAALMPTTPGATADWEPYYARYERDTRAFVRMMRARRIAVFIASSPPSASFVDASNGWGRLDDIYRRVASEEGATYVAATRLAVARPDGTRTESLPCLSIEPCSNSPRRGHNPLFAPDHAHFGCAVPVPPAVNGVTAPCTAHSSGALRYGLAIVESVRGELDGRRFRAPRVPRSLIDR